MSRLLLAQSQEMQSRMLLLQNQINPHFLYNSLAVIAVMAEEGMQDEIVATCDVMADILRYLSADDNGEITLEQEIDIVIQYLSCMELRYQQNLQVQRADRPGTLSCTNTKTCATITGGKFNQVRFLLTAALGHPNYWKLPGKRLDCFGH